MSWLNRNRALCLLLSFLMTSRWVVYGFIEVALSVILRDAGASLAQISLMLAAGVLFLFKFLWAPLVDRVRLSRRSQYLAWYFWMQLLMAIGLAGLFWFRPEKHFYEIFFLLVVISIVASLRDIAMDGLAIKLLSDEQRANANGWMSAGFMFGMLLGGGVLLLGYAHIGWIGVVVALVASTLITLPVIFWIREPADAHAVDARVTPGFMDLFRNFFKVPGNRRWSIFLVLHAVYAIAGSSLIGVMLVDIKWSVARIGLVLNIVGPAIAVIASLLIGWAFARSDRQRALVIVVIVQAVFNLALLPIIGQSYSDIVTSIVVVGTVLVSAISNLVIKTVAMDKSAATADKGTYFTLQASLSQIGGTIALVAAPAVADHVGYPPVIWFGVVAGLLAVLLLTGMPRSDASGGYVPDQSRG